MDELLAGRLGQRPLARQRPVASPSVPSALTGSTGAWSDSVTVSGSLALPVCCATAVTNASAPGTLLRLKV